MSNNNKAAIVMQTDYSDDISVSTMRGVCMMIDTELRLFDSTHNIPPFNTYIASTSLDYIVDFWPEGTVFISVVDPGVGTDRRASVAKLKNGSYVVTPDNGTLTHLNNRIGIEAVRTIDEETNRLQSTKAVSIFHGRDLLAYCAAKLASGIISFEEVGPEYHVEEVVIHEVVPHSLKDNKISGMISSADFHFGLVCSNIPYHVFETENIGFGDTVHVKIKNNATDETVFEGDVSYEQSFEAVPVGAPVLMISETQEIQIALNLKNMTTEYDIGVGPEWTMEITK